MSDLDYYEQYRRGDLVKLKGRIGRCPPGDWIDLTTIERNIAIELGYEFNHICTTDRGGRLIHTLEMTQNPRYQ